MDSAVFPCHFRLILELKLWDFAREKKGLLFISRENKERTKASAAKTELFALFVLVKFFSFKTKIQGFNQTMKFVA